MVICLPIYGYKKPIKLNFIWNGKSPLYSIEIIQIVAKDDCGVIGKINIMIHNK